MQRLKELGFRGIILTYAKETVFDHVKNTEHAQGATFHSPERGNNISISEGKINPDIEAWRKGTLETIDIIDEGDYLALKYAHMIFLTLIKI